MKSLETTYGSLVQCGCAELKRYRRRGVRLAVLHLSSALPWPTAFHCWPSQTSPGQLGGACWLPNDLPVGRLQQPPLSTHHWHTPALPRAAAPPRRGRISTSAPSWHPQHLLPCLAVQLWGGDLFDHPIVQGEGLGNSMG